jgi:tRNA1(Val) A37 N6-methylase TrmN6
MKKADLEQTLDLQVTEDAFLGDRLMIRQPRHGYRAGVDAVLLAATVQAGPRGPKTLLDAGAGVGTVGLCAAARIEDLNAVLLEREADLAALAAGNVRNNGLEARVRAVAASVTSSAAELDAQGLAANAFDICLSNPPFHDTQTGTLARDSLKAASHAMAQDTLDAWARFMARMVKQGGRATVIHKADALPRLLAAIGSRFGDLSVFPVYPRAGESAIRVIVSGLKGSRAPLKLKSGLVLHGDGQAFTTAANAILRHGASLEI